MTAAAVVLVALMLMGVVIAVAVLGRLRSDLKVVQAVERHELVDFTSLVMKHVPEDLRTGQVDDEIPVVRQRIWRKRFHWRLMGCGFVVLAGIAGWGAFVAIRQGIAAAEALAANEDLSSVATSLIQGEWGWKFDHERSCAVNPHIITVVGHTLTVTTKEPHWNGYKNVRTDEFDILATNRRGLTLGLSGDQPSRPGGRITWQFIFQDRNTYYVKRSDVPTAETGIIIRCPT